jgi:flavin reductase (DIM6/NTAB) family NADH-FMN oxidoreductase RutF
MTTKEPIERGAPLDDSRAFRRCLGQFATGVAVVTARHGDQLVGMSVNSFSALSLDPPLVLWSIRRESASLAAYRAAGHFCVNVLGADQAALSNLFASPASGKFAQADWAIGRHGTPLLPGAIAHMECAVHDVLEGGDHLIMVGRVLEYARFEGDPLLFAQGRYGIREEHPDAAPGATLQAGPGPGAGDGATVLRLLHQASHHLSVLFAEHATASDIQLVELRLYGLLRIRACTLERLKSLAYVGTAEALDMVGQMGRRGHLDRHADGTLQLTQTGRDHALQLVQRLQRFEAGVLHSIAKADIQTTRRVLCQLAAHAPSMAETATSTEHPGPVAARVAS